MQVNPTTAAAATAASNGPVPLRVLSGPLTAVPVGELVRATVTQATPKGATLTVNGQSVTVAPSPALTPGAAVVVRLPAAAAPVLELVGPAPPPTQSTPAAVRVLAGDLSAVPTGQPLRATVTQAGQDSAVLTVNGQRLTVGTPTPLAPGAAVVVRLPTAAAPVLELVGSAPAPPPQTAAPARPASSPVALVDVRAAAPDGRFFVTIDGQPATAASDQALVPGGRYALRVEVTPSGLVLRPPAEVPDAPDVAAAAVLRAAKPPDLGAAVAPLLKELAELRPPTAPTPPTVREAAAAVQEVVRSFLPPDGKPPDAKQLQALVEDGGLHFEAKLARLADGDAPDPQAASAAATTDLKGALLRLLQAARDAGAAVPAAAAALESVETQQAANALAQPTGGPYFLQVPFPDDGRWKTLALAIERDRAAQADADGPPTGARVMVHVPLSRLGETWVEAGVSGGRFRAVVYLDAPADRARVRAELPDLRTALLGDGFADVLLDVRPPSDLPAARRAAVKAGRPTEVPVLDVRA